MSAGAGEDLTARRIAVLTIFPEVVEAYLEVGVVGRARRAGRLAVEALDLRVGADDPHRGVDDAPFGGGAGMVLAPGPTFAAVERLDPPRPLYLLSPAGRPFDQAMAAGLADEPGFSLLCGRYEGVDERIAEHLADGEISIGDFVLAGGELAALVVLEAVARLLPGVLGNEASLEEESFAEGLLEYPQYTRPASFRGWEVPEVLRGGNHAQVARWRSAAALARTIERRPDLLAARGVTDAEVRLLLEQGYPGAAATAREFRAPAPTARSTEEHDPS